MANLLAKPAPTSQAKTMPATVLILSSAESEENIALNDTFVTNLNAALGQDNCAVEWQNYHGIGLELAANMLEAFVVDGKRPLTGYKAVYFKSYFRHQEQATSIVESLIAHQVPFVGSELRHYIPAHKLSQLARLARAGITIPHTIYLSLEHYVAHYEELVEKLGDSFVFKAIDGSTGDDNYLVRNKTQLENIVADNEGRHFIAEAFVPNDSDYRILIVGGEIKLIIKRSRKDDTTHLNNTSQGAGAELVALDTVSQETKQIALKSAEIMGRDVAGVDIMFETGTHVPYVLEVNASPQIASGAFEAEKLNLYSEFFKRLAL